MYHTIKQLQYIELCRETPSMLPQATIFPPNKSHRYTVTITYQYHYFVSVYILYADHFCIVDYKLWWEWWWGFFHWENSTDISRIILQIWNREKFWPFSIILKRSDSLLEYSFYISYVKPTSPWAWKREKRNSFGR